MNSDHFVGATVAGAPSATVMLASVLEHFQEVDASTAGSEAGLILLVLGAIGGLIYRLLPPSKGAALEPLLTVPAPIAVVPHVAIGPTGILPPIEPPTGATP